MATAATAAVASKIRYRFLGNSGLLVSNIGLGAWMMLDERCSDDKWYEIMKYAYEKGVNFIDNSETYAGGESERIVGRAVKRGIAEGVWAREDLVITTKIFNGTKQGPNAQGLGRKHLVEGTKASLKRLDLDYVDVLYCHRPEPYTPIEEIVRSMNWLINQGLAFYWGTSQWLAVDIIEACETADRLGLIRPIVEQPKYNIFDRPRVEGDFEILYTKYKLGLSTYSPLAYGVLSGKYTADAEAPPLSRFTMQFYHSMVPDFAMRVVKAYKIKEIAEELGCSIAQFSIAWAAQNPNVSTALLGARTIEQLKENLGAIPFIEKITPEIRARVDVAIEYLPERAEPDPLATTRSKYL